MKMSGPSGAVDVGSTVQLTVDSTFTIGTIAYEVMSERERERKRGRRQR